MFESMARATLAPCPRCGGAPTEEPSSSRLATPWFRVHCRSCRIGVGAPVPEVAREKWERTVERWGR